MGVPVVCESCATKLAIPADYARSKMQCPTCGIYCAIPPNAERAAAVSDADETEAEPAAAEPKPVAGGPLLVGTDEDDGRPYTVPGDPVDPARALKKAAPARPLTPLSKSWENGWSLQTRIQTYVALLALNGLALFFSTIFLDDFFGATIMVLLACALLAFLVGTFDRIGLNRNSKGQVRLTRAWRVAFFPMPARTLRWSEHESVSACISYEPHFEDWTVMFVLLPYALVPGVLWWWFVIRPIRYQVILFKDHGFPETVLYRTQDKGLADRVADTVADVTGLPIKREAEQARGGQMIGR